MLVLFLLLFIVLLLLWLYLRVFGLFPRCSSASGRLDFPSALATITSFPLAEPASEFTDVSLWLSLSQECRAERGTSELWHSLTEIPRFSRDSR